MSKSIHHSAAVRALTILLLLAVAGFWAAPDARAAATPPNLMAYQGFLAGADGTPLGNTQPDAYTVVFGIYAAQSGGDPLWDEQQTVTVDKGYFSVLLGEGTEVTPNKHDFLSNLVFAEATASERYVQMTVLGIGTIVEGEPSDVTILPRLRLLTSPYAFLADRAGALIDEGGANIVSIAPGSGISVAGTVSATTAVSAPTVTTTTVNATDVVATTVTATTLEGNGTIPIGGIIMWSGAINNIPAGWALCNGQQGTPPLQDKFIAAAGGKYPVSDVGGADAVTLQVSQTPLPYHTHGYSDRFDSDNPQSGTWGLAGDQEPNGDDVARKYLNRTTGAAYNNSNILAHENRPSFYALAFIMRVQ